VGFRSAQTIADIPSAGALRLVMDDRCSARRAEHSSTDDASAAQLHRRAASAHVGEHMAVIRFAPQGGLERRDHPVAGPTCADTRRVPRWSDQ
jgi:hypothetical protein